MPLFVLFVLLSSVAPLVMDTFLVVLAELLELLLLELDDELLLEPQAANPTANNAVAAKRETFFIVEPPCIVSDIIAHVNYITEKCKRVRFSEQMRTS